jgi:hypothetical protein
LNLRPPSVRWSSFAINAGAIRGGRRFWLAHGIIGHVRLPSLQPYFF